MTAPLLQLQQVSKTFGQRAALDRVSFTLEAGEIIGVTGRRSSGKSTLLHVLSGVVAPTAGSIDFAGKRLALTRPHQARALGIELVSQKPALVEQLDVVSNIFLGREPGRLRPDWPAMMSQARAWLARLDSAPGLLETPVSALSDEQRQLVALARALCRPAKLLLLDDALDALSFGRQEVVLHLLQELSRAGTAVIIASDNLKHLLAVTHRVLVLYEGRLVADRITADATPRELVEMIVGLHRAEQVTPVIWALENYHMAQRQAEELRQAQASLQESLAAQGSRNAELFQQLQNQVRALDQLNQALQAAQKRLLTEREQERKHLARELHDVVIQELLSVNYRLEDVSENLTDPAQAEIDSLRGTIRQAVGELRQLCSDLRPPTIDNHGLAAAIRSHAHEWAEQNGVAVRLEIAPEVGRLPEAMELSIFRIVQEALNNVRKHARATQVQVQLGYTPSATVRLRITDNGAGLTQPVDYAALSARKHFGLVGISERVALLGGTVRIESAESGGTCLEVDIPSPSPLV